MKDTIVNGLIKKAPFESMTDYSGLFCPYCGMEDGEHPENIIEYSGEYVKNECYDCGKEYKVMKETATIYTSKK